MVIKGLEFLSKVGNMAKKPAMDLIKNSRLPSRWKKYFQGETLGEAKIKPIAKSSRSTVPYEISAFVKGGGTTLSLTAIYSYLTSEKKDSMRKMAEATGIKDKPKPKTLTKFQKDKIRETKPKPKSKSKTLTQSQKDKIRGTFRTITVQKNDNITRIAKRAGVSKTTLEKLNPKVKKNPDLIYPGQKIKIGGK